MSRREVSPSTLRSAHARDAGDPDGPDAERFAAAAPAARPPDDERIEATAPRARHPSNDARRRVAARRRRAQLRRRRSALLLAITAVALGITFAIGGSSPRARRAPRRSALAVSASPSGPPAIEAGLMPWSLAAPISREAVAPLPSADGLLVLGGLDAAGASGSSIYRLDLRTGAATVAGRLPQGTHDAAAGALSDGVLVIGGGTAAPAPTVQLGRFSGDSSTQAPLPEPRADASAVSIGGTVYVVGGYDGTSMDAAVLATSDGHDYRRVATLLVPVRYPALAALAGRIYVLGGDAVAGEPVDAIQVIDPRTGQVHVEGHLPIALAGAAAGVLDGNVYLAGGLAGAGHDPSRAIYVLDLAHHSVLSAGSLLVGVANAGSAVLNGHLYLVGGEANGGRPTGDVQVLTANRRFGTAGAAGAGSPYYGDQLLVADRGNNRLLLLDDTGKVIWTFPGAGEPTPAGGFYFPDDAFVIDKGRAIISNQEENDTVVELAYPSGRVLWQYGHSRTAGSAPGYLDNPDDAYLLRNGAISVADPMNCRVLVLDPRSKAVLTQIGTPGGCIHNPPNELGSPNGDTPLSDGNLLVSEINGSWIDEYTTTGRLVWDVQLPSVGYVSDPQQIGPDRYLVADYEDPGAFVEFNRAGQILYRYGPSSGPGALNHPSLVEQLPSGVLMANDDDNDRIVAVDPTTGALVWEYGTNGVAGSRAGRLNTPDGFDLVAPGGVTPTHRATG